MRRGRTPYQQFGRRLTEIRKRLQETVPEVSGAVEIDSDVFARFEAGEERPSEDVLMLLINHFDMKDDEADELWELAGYTMHDSPQEELPTIPTLVVVPTDNRIVYTDTAHVSINNFGVVMNFMQNSMNGHANAVARVGMSLEHAKSVLEVLVKTIAQAEAAATPKHLPSSIAPKTQKRKS